VKFGRRAVIELLLALVAAVGCVLSWRASISTVDVPPILDNEPWTTSLVYSPSLLTLSLLLATVAGVLAVLGVARLRRPPVHHDQTAFSTAP
jgi:ABC-type spermidine/putrescine transport system permease subunit II